MLGSDAGVFRLVLRDDALTPRLRAGDFVELTPGMQPRPGDGVLVRDALGGHYVRIYRERRPGEWSAAPLNQAYDVLDAAACGLTVVAVVTGEGRTGRWV